MGRFVSVRGGEVWHEYGGGLDQRCRYRMM